MGQTQPAAVHAASATDALVERLFQSAIQTLEIFSIYLGRKLGLYDALAARGPLTFEGLARAAGIDARYAREWLEQQAVAGFVAVDDDGAAPGERRFSLPAEHTGVFVDDTAAEHVSPLSQLLVGVAGTLPRMVEAYRTGEGISFEEFGVDMREGQGAINKPAFLHDLTRAWLPSVPDVDARLRAAGPPARIADLGCGVGWSTIALARDYPDAEVIGYDLDRGSIEDARRNAARAGVDVRFECRSAADIKRDGPFDLVLLLEALHDMAHPAEVLAACGRALAPGGSVIVADERVAETFRAPGDEIERMMYGWSVGHCLAASRSETGSAAIGTAIRPATVRECAERAGLTRFEILPIENELFRFYRMRNEL